MSRSILQGAANTHQFRDSITIASLQQSSRFDELDRKTQNILIALLDNRHTQQEDLLKQRIAIAQMLNHTEVLLTNQHDQTRALIADAMRIAATLTRVGEDFGTDAERKNAEAIRQEEENMKLEVEHQILESLYFEAMAERQEEVDEAHRNTFGWLFNPPETGQTWSSFVDWLRSDSSTYWINGKAGSGKSTLMRYICESERTEKELLLWAGSLPLTMSSFFFWNGGTIEQRSQTGLLRSLLYNTLRRYPELIPIVMPSIWARGYSQAIDPWEHYKPEPFNLKTLTQFFKRLLQQTLVPLKICFFIDGLDEYEGSPADLADLFTEVATSNNVKVCLSSRPLVAYEYAFETCPSLRLQDLTVEDIRSYVYNTLHIDKRFQNLCLREPERAPQLVTELVTKADGVFLWVKVVIRSILTGLGNRDHIIDLQKRLRELPSDLEALYEHMLMKRIEPFYREKASSLFQIVRASRDLNDRLEKLGETRMPLTLISLSFADDDDPNLAFTSDIKLLPELKLSIRCNTTEDRLKVRCAGLLELHGMIDRSNPDARLELAKLHWKVRYLHRTVRDYLEQENVWTTIIALTRNSDFNPNVSLLKSCLLQLKTSPIENTKTLPDTIWRCAALGLEHCREAELKQDPAYIALLDQLDLVMTWHAESKGSTYPGHWARHYLAEYDLEDYERPIGWADSIMTIAVEYGLCSYLEYKFRQTSNAPFENAAEKPGRPLLDYAVSQNPTKQRYHITAEVVAVLLQHGANPNLRYNSTTARENALAFAYSLQFPKAGKYLFESDRVKPSRTEVMELVQVFSHFISHGADLNGSCIIRAGYEKPNERRPVLYIVKDVFVRWYPEESVALVHELARRGASEELISDFTVFRALAWNRLRGIRARIWY